MPEGEKRPRHRPERWDVSWADLERAQLRTMLDATPAQRLAWLEEAMRLAHASGALAAAHREREARDGSPPHEMTRGRIPAAR